LRFTANQNMELCGSGFWTNRISLWVGQPSTIQATTGRIKTQIDFKKIVTLCQTCFGQD